MSASLKVDIIVPLSGSVDDCQSLLNALSSQKDLISKVVIVLSKSRSPNARRLSDVVNINVCSKLISGLRVLVVTSDKHLYPGYARNIALRYVSSSYIAFIDKNTIPTQLWLRNALSSIVESKYEAIVGKTVYTSTSYASKIVIASAYGFNPVSSLPGTVLTATALSLTGGFLPFHRSGEDIDFLSRLKQFHKTSDLKTPLNYKLDHSNPLFYIRKWFAYYATCAPYRTLYLQSFVLNSMFAIMLLAVSYLWNWVVAGWNESSILYLQNITKIVAASLFSLYVAVRVVIRPISLGAFSIGKCMPPDLIPILAMCASLDLTKLSAFLFRGLTHSLNPTRASPPTTL